VPQKDYIRNHIPVIQRCHTIYDAPKKNRQTKCLNIIDNHPVRLSLSAESATIQQCFSLTINQRTVLSATINQQNEQAE
jgi:hypothetical protein